MANEPVDPTKDKRYGSAFYAVAPNGVEKWHYDTGGDVVSSPAIAADGTVYVGSRDFLLKSASCPCSCQGAEMDSRYC